MKSHNLYHWNGWKFQIIFALKINVVKMEEVIKLLLWIN